jgi:hypothetical protein
VRRLAGLVCADVEALEALDGCEACVRVPGDLTSVFGLVPGTHHFVFVGVKCIFRMAQDLGEIRQKLGEKHDRILMEVQCSCRPLELTEMDRPQAAEEFSKDRRPDNIHQKV